MECLAIRETAVGERGPRARRAAAFKLAARLLAKDRGVDSAAEPSDADLIARVANGDRAAFAELFSAYAPRVKSYLLRLGANAALADDMAQDALLSVWRRAASYDRKKAGASTWIFVIARNCWIDKLRRERVEFAYRSSLYDGDESAPDVGADRELELCEDQGRVRAAMEVLSEDQQAVVRLSFFEERPHSEIADVLALPLGTVKSRLRLAMAKLRAHLEQY
jgi:RNA polymerase sigma-70 factor (ECF subfamily)